MIYEHSFLFAFAAISCNTSYYRISTQPTVRERPQ